MKTSRFTDRDGRSPRFGNPAEDGCHKFEIRDCDAGVWTRLELPTSMDNKPSNSESSLIGMALDIALAAIALAWVIALIIILTLK